MVLRSSYLSLQCSRSWSTVLGYWRLETSGRVGYRTASFIMGCVAVQTPSSLSAGNDVTVAVQYSTVRLLASLGVTNESTRVE
jgi:hypothetical protein